MTVTFPGSDEEQTVGTGYITKEQFPRLLGELSGVFEMRIYSQEHSVRRILEDVQSAPTSGRIMSMASASSATGVNLKALNKRLAEIDAVEVRRSRARYNLFFEEVMVMAENEAVRKNRLALLSELHARRAMTTFAVQPS